MAPSTLAEVQALREALTAAELRAAVAEARAEERERVIEAQAQALRMLEAPVMTQSEQPVKPLAASEQPPEPRPIKRRWWHL